MLTDVSGHNELMMVTSYIGKDVHSKVYKGHYMNSEEMFAVKVFIKPR